MVELTLGKVDGPRDINPDFERRVAEIREVPELKLVRIIFLLRVPAGRIKHMDLSIICRSGALMGRRFCLRWTGSRFVLFVNQKNCLAKRWDLPSRLISVISFRKSRV